jgi:hypothetical protein
LKTCKPIWRSRSTQSERPKKQPLPTVMVGGAGG